MYIYTCYTFMSYQSDAYRNFEEVFEIRRQLTLYKFYIKTIDLTITKLPFLSIPTECCIFSNVYNILYTVNRWYRQLLIKIYLKKKNKQINKLGNNLISITDQIHNCRRLIIQRIYEYNMGKYVS